MQKRFEWFLTKLLLDKKIKIDTVKKILFLLIVLASFSSYGQGLKKPSEGKSLIYFVRTSSTGFLINFKYFDGEKYLGKFNYGKYSVYECDPGKHLFWAKSENTDYLEVELEAGKIYIIDSEPHMGAIKAGVKLIPFDNNPSNYKNSKKYDNKKESVLKSITTGEEYIASTEAIELEKQDLESLIIKTLEKYKKQKEKGNEFAKMPLEMYFE